MTRSGIKRGLAVSAVSALSIVGLPAAAHAVGPAATVTASPASASVLAYQTDAINGSAKAADGTAATTGTIAITVTQTTPSTVTSNPLNVAGGTNNPTSTAGSAANTVVWTSTASASPADGTNGTTAGAFSVSVGSSVAGTVNVKAAAAAGTANTSFTVTGSGSTNADDVTGLSVTSSSAVTAYKTVDPAAYTIKSSGAFVPMGNGATGGTFAIVKPSAPTTPVATGVWSSPDSDTTTAGLQPAFGADPYSTTIDLRTATYASGSYAALDAGSYIVEFWDNQDNHATNTQGPDAGEPSVTGSLNLVDAPTSNLDTGANASSTSKYAAGFAHYGTTTAFTGADDATNNKLPDDAAVNIPLSAQVDTTTTTRPAAGTKFWFDVKVGTKDTVRVAGTYDASTGLVTGTYAATAADAATDAAVNVKLAVSQSSTAGDGSVTNLGTVSTFVARHASIAQLPGAVANVQATVGGTVSIPVVVADQFGKPSIGDVLKFVVAGQNSVNTTTAPTNSNGQTTISYTAAHGTKGQSDTVNATDVTNPAVGALTPVTVTFINGTTAPAAVAGTASSTAVPTDPNAAVPVDTNGAYKTNLAVSATGNSADYGNDFVVYNSLGEPLTNATVTLTAVGGEVTYGTGASAKTGASVTAVTDTDGKVVGPIKIGSEKLGTVSLTVSAGAASYSFKPVEVTQVGNPYSIVPVTTPQTIKPGDSAKFIFEVTDEFGNAVQGASVNFGLGSNTAPGVLSSNSSGFSDQNGNVDAIVDTTSSDLGAGAVTATPRLLTTPAWTLTKDAAATATFTDPNGKGVSIAYTVAAPVVVTHPTAGEQKLATDTAKLSKDKAALASATAKLSKDKAKLAKDKKALKHAKRHKKAVLKKAIKKLKKAIAADKKAVAAVNRAITADNKAIAADKAAIAAGK